MPEPGSSLEKKLAWTLLAQTQRGADWKEVRWLNSPLFCSVCFVPDCTVTSMLSLSFEPHSPPRVPRAKDYDAPAEALNGLQ